MNLLENINEKSQNIFDKNNINQSVKMYLFLIDVEINGNVDNLNMQEIVSKYLKRIDEIFELSIVDGISQLKPRIIEKYSVLKYFFDTRKDILYDYFLNVGLDKKETGIDISKFKVLNILTKEEIKLSKKDKKTFLNLLRNYIKNNGIEENYTLSINENDGGKYIITNIEESKTKKLL